MDKAYIAIIPARYNSSRFMGKPLANILDKPMIWWVYNNVKEMNIFKDVYIATDDHRIFDVCSGFGANTIMTGTFENGTSRIMSVSKELDFDVVVNIQGDEPLVSKEQIVSLLSAFSDSAVSVSTLKKEISKDEAEKSEIVKVVTDRHDNALYFSRSKIPFNREDTSCVSYYKHIGIYAFSKRFTQIYDDLHPSIIEECEKLEQLRILDNGYKIKVMETNYQSIAVDLPEHIALVEQALLDKHASCE